MRLPDLSPQALADAIPALHDVRAPLQGGQKLVFPCRISDSSYALKVMLAEEPNWPDPAGGREQVSEAEMRLRREDGIMRRCHSTHLPVPGPIGVTLIDAADQRIAYSTERWVEGHNLRDVLRRTGSLKFSEVMQLGIDIAQAIDVLWSERVVHRDIKPSNIMRRSPSGEFVLLDLGSALDLKHGIPVHSGHLSGTRLYFSPERVTSQGPPLLDLRSDLFSLGIVLYEATTGIHPFLDRPDNGDVLHRIVHAHPLRPSSHRKQVPPCLSSTIMRLLKKSAERRYRSGAQLIYDLETCMRDRPRRFT